jgi:hypothetical protein
MNIKKGKYYRFDAPNGFTVKALDNSYDATFRAVVVLQDDYSHEVGHISSAWSNTSFVESDLSEFLEEANKRYPMGSRYVSLGGDPEGVKGRGVSSVEYEAKIWYYNDELRGIDMGNYVVYNFCVDKWAEIINDQVDTEETLIEAEFDLTTDDGRLAYARKYYPIGTKYRPILPIVVSGETYDSIITSEYKPRIWVSDRGCNNGIEVSKLGLVYYEGTNKWAEIIKEETNMETQKLSRKGLKEIHSVACEKWKVILEDWGSSYPLEDYIELSQKTVDRMFNASDDNQKSILSKYLKQDDGFLDFSEVSGSYFKFKGKELIATRTHGELQYKSFILNYGYNWEIKKDGCGQLCLIPTKKK